MNGLQKFYKAIKISRLRRCCIICTCRKSRIKHKYFEGATWPNFERAPEPSLILWNNLGISKGSRMVRTFLINLFSAIVMLCGFLMISYGKRYSEGKQLPEKFDFKSCDAFNEISQEAAILDFEDMESSGNVVGCYCYKKV